jgi:hypothetical protein
MMYKIFSIGDFLMKLSQSLAIAVGVCLVFVMLGPQVAVQGQETQIDAWTPLPVKPKASLQDLESDERPLNSFEKFWRRVQLRLKPHSVK